jgi:hypothetical protein
MLPQSSYGGSPIINSDDGSFGSFGSSSGYAPLYGGFYPADADRFDASGDGAEPDATAADAGPDDVQVDAGDADAEDSNDADGGD